MKKTKRTAMIAAAFAAAVSLTACSGGSSAGKADDVTPGAAVSSSFDASSEEPQEVYGPPTDFDVTSEEVQDVYGPPVDYDPSSDNVQTEYEAPVDYEDSDAGLESYDPKTDSGEIQTVYGPPEAFDDSAQ